MFSTSAISSWACGVTSLTTTGTRLSPARRAACQRRSPAISSKRRPGLPGSSRQTSGCSTPCWRIDWASSSSVAASTCWRGWRGFRTIESISASVSPEPLGRSAPSPRPSARPRSIPTAGPIICPDGCALRHAPTGARSVGSRSEPVGRTLAAVSVFSTSVTGSLRGRVALVTGGSRGVGRATVVELARVGAAVVVNYRNKARRAEEAAAAARGLGVRALAVPADITDDGALAAMVERVRAELGRLDVLVLNASGGMEKELVAVDPDYAMRVNRDANLRLVELARPLMPPGGVIVHVTSHLAHYYGRIEQPPIYEPVARSKHAGEAALSALAPELAASGLRLAVVSGDLIEDTIVPRLMDRASPGLIEGRRAQAGALPTTGDMAAAIVRAALDERLPTGAVQIGRAHV